MDQNLKLIEHDLGCKLHWLNEPDAWHSENGRISIEPDPDTDLFRRFKDQPIDNACFLRASLRGDFTMSVHAELSAAGPFDAAALLVMADGENWAKLCIERSNTGITSIVSVVTHPWSDDAAGEILESPSGWLRISRKGPMLGMQYSQDGRYWRFVRVYGWNFPEELMIGISAQSPKGHGAKVSFDHWRIYEHPVEDLRSGN